MNETNPILLVLRLEGPMQSWGLRARWDYRDTGTEPSKSGIVGLIGCALGYKRGDKRLENELDESFTIAIREEIAGIEMIDFQTVKGDHLKAKGGQQAKTIVSPRAYLHDASFLAFVQGPKKLLEKCAHALHNPRWPIYLGRRSCPPTRPVLEAVTTEYSSLEDAVRKYPWDTHLHLINKKWRWSKLRRKKPEKLRYIIEDPKNRAIRRDAFRVNPARMYGNRNVREDWISLPNLQNDIEGGIK